MAMLITQASLVLSTLCTGESRCRPVWLWLQTQTFWIAPLQSGSMTSKKAPELKCSRQFVGRAVRLVYLQCSSVGIPRLAGEGAIA
jgi:hypothetical protein